MQELVEVSDDSADTKIRLLVCKTCVSIQPIPDYQGNPDHDELLHARVTEHQYPGSHPTRGHDMELGRVSERSWNDPEKRHGIIAEIEKNVGTGQGAGLGDQHYDVQSTFMDDAMRCWRIAHNRTTDCGDYMSDRMTLLADSVAERKDLGLDPKQRAKLKLCQFCPYHATVQQRANAKRFR
jgi:hypothetical protein